jgi:glutamate racemase
VWRALRAAAPGLPCLYLADQAHVPYGPRPLAEVTTLTHAAVRWLLAQGAQAVVIACNTATAAALDALRAAHAGVPFVGIEPAIKPAATATRSGVLAVLATQATFASARYAALRQRYAANLVVLEQPCPDWVQLVERGATASTRAYARVRERVLPTLEQGADQLLLGCTHFPFLRAQIERVIADHGALATIIDPAPAVVAQALRVVAPLNPAGWPRSETRFVTTGRPETLQRAIRRYCDVSSHVTQVVC